MVQTSKASFIIGAARQLEPQQTQDLEKHMIPIAPATGKGLIFVHASWCTPCQRTKPGVEEIANDDNGIEVVMIDGDEDLDTPAQLELKTFPLVLLTNDGEEVARRGSGTKEEILAWIEENTKAA